MKLFQSSAVMRENYPILLQSSEMDFIAEVQDSYERLWELRDPRADHLPLMGSYLPVIIISLIYVYLVKVWGPRHMEGKDPYEMRYFVNLRTWKRLQRS